MLYYSYFYLLFTNYNCWKWLKKTSLPAVSYVITALLAVLGDTVSVQKLPMDISRAQCVLSLIASVKLNVFLDAVVPRSVWMIYTHLRMSKACLRVRACIYIYGDSQ